MRVNVCRMPIELVLGHASELPLSWRVVKFSGVLRLMFATWPSRSMSSLIPYHEGKSESFQHSEETKHYMQGLIVLMQAPKGSADAAVNFYAESPIYFQQCSLGTCFTLQANLTTPY